MEDIKKLIAEAKPDTISDYFRLYGRIRSDDIISLKNDKNNCKIALLSSSTIKGLDKILFVKCLELGVVPEIYCGEYNQYNQEIINAEGALYRFRPDIVYLFIDSRAWLADLYLNPYANSRALKNHLKMKFEELAQLAEKIKDASEAKLIIHNFEVPTDTAYGISDNRLNFGLADSIRKFNLDLSRYFSGDGRVFVLDYESFSSKHGKYNTLDYKLYYLADIKLDLKFLPALADEYLGYIIPLKSLAKKCLVLDLDNTLWGGIIGEDGLDGIRLGPTPEGRSFFEFQQYIKALHEKGIILAINSKNNPNDVKEVFRKHPYMVLKPKHFAAEQINWQDKGSNMKIIAKDLNIGLDSMVFLDDDRLNREIVRSACPAVKVVEMPEDPALYLRTIMSLKDFNQFKVTDEDRKKGKMYIEQKKRKKLEASINNIDDYIKKLGMEVTIEKMNDFSLPRLAQLTQKTNQFNLTTKRYLEEDLLKMEKNDHLICSVAVKDKYGDNGITGLFILKDENDDFSIDSFLLSCRVIGRRVENVMFEYILEQAQAKNKKIIYGSFLPTEKNMPCRDFFANSGFVPAGKNGDTEIWKYAVDKANHPIDFIKLIKK
jgi:FkbH-like protein